MPRFIPRPRLVRALALAFVAAPFAGCGSSQQATRLPDGSWKVQCVDQPEHCMRQAERVCGDRDYQILGGGKRTKVYGGATGEQNVSAVRTLVLRCSPKRFDHAEAGNETGAEAAPEPEPAPPSEPAPKPAVKPKKRVASPAPESPAERVCAPGSTQRCVGAGACDGGQSCKEDGSGYLPCDCGGDGTGAAGAKPPASAEPR